MNIYLWAMLASIAVYLVIGNWAGRKVKHLDDFFVAGRQAPTLLIVGTLVASLLSTNAFLGEVGFAYDGFGGPMLILILFNIFGYLGGALLFGRFLRRSRALTVAEYFGKRFNCRRVQAAAGVTIIVGLGAYLVAVTQGVTLVVTQVADIPYWLALVIVWAGYTIFTMNAGSRGVVITDTIMFLLFTGVSVVALFFIVKAAGGWTPTIEALATNSDTAGIISWHGATGPDATWKTPVESVTWAVILGLAWAGVVAVSPWQASRYLMAKNEHTVVRSACGATVAMLLFYPILMLGAAAIRLLNPDIEPSERAILWAATNVMPAFVGAVLMAGVLAAGLSSATTFLSLVGFSASHDVWQGHRGSPAKQLRASRLAMLAVSLVALGVAAMAPTNILWITYFAGTVFASSWGPVAVMSVWSKTITERAAMWGIISGFLGNVVPKAMDFLGVIDLPVWADPILIGALISLVVIIVLSRAGTVSEPESNYREALHVTPEPELDPVLIRQTARWPGAMTAIGLALIVSMCAFWARPYAQAIGRDHWWLSGETLLSVGWGLSLVLIAGVLRRHLVELKTA